MTTSHDTSMDRVDRRPAQTAAMLGVLFAVVAFFWDSGLPSFLLALVGLIVAVVGAFLSPDGWLVAEEDE